MSIILRKCLRCGLEAKNLEELKQFKPHPKMLYGYSNLCRQCANRQDRYDGIYGNHKRAYANQRNKKRLRFKGIPVLLSENPRKNVCSKCGAKYPEQLKTQTCLHHERYDPNDPLAHIIELCHPCHTKLHHERGDISCLMGNVLVLPHGKGERRRCGCTGNRAKSWKAK